MPAPNTVRKILYHLLVFHEAQDEFFALTVGSWNTPIAKHIRKVQKNAVAARFVTTARFVTKLTKRVKFDALPARFVTPACFVNTWWQNVPKGPLAARFVTLSPAAL